MALMSLLNGTGNVVYKLALDNVQNVCFLSCSMNHISLYQLTKRGTTKGTNTSYSDFLTRASFCLHADMRGAQVYGRFSDDNVTE